VDTRPGEDGHANAIPGAGEIALGRVAVESGDGVPDECGCIGDVDQDDAVGIGDLLARLGTRGRMPAPPRLDRHADISQNGVVGLVDIDDPLIVLARRENGRAGRRDQSSNTPAHSGRSGPFSVNAR
jgi:hypothetical protein